MASTPLLFTSTGPVATPPATLQQQLIADVASTNPDYTANLPGSLIEDISSTDVGALVTIDQARVDAVNSVSPYAANPFVLAQQGQVLGIPQGGPSNGSAIVVFSGSPGYVIPMGFLVGDGTNQYVVVDGGVVGAGGSSQSLFVQATNSGIFAIPAGSIDQTVTSVPSPFTLTVTNALAGVPAQISETTENFRSRILGGMNVAIQGTAAYLKTLLMAVPGVSPRLVSVQQQGTMWEVICGGGDPFQVAGAIYQGVGQIGLLTGSLTSIRNVNVSIYDAPDTYNIVYVNPPTQTTLIACIWNTTLINFTAAASVNQLIVAAEQSYVNSIVVGQPMNLLVLQEQVQAAVASVLAPVNLTTLQFTVTINGNITPPTAGTSLIPSDPESSFFVSATGATSAQG